MCASFFPSLRFSHCLWFYELPLIIVSLFCVFDSSAFSLCDPFWYRCEWCCEIWSFILTVQLQSFTPNMTTVILYAVTSHNPKLTNFKKTDSEFFHYLLLLKLLNSLVLQLLLSTFLVLIGLLFIINFVLVRGSVLQTVPAARQFLAVLSYSVVLVINTTLINISIHT